MEQAAAKNNPELKSALAALGVSNADVLAARAAYLPDLGLNVTYGIDAPQVAVNGPDGVRNLGYSAAITVDIPVWDWLSTEHRVKQSEIRRDAAKVALSATQRQLIARLDEAYSEAEAARDQLDSLDLSAATAAESLKLTKTALQRRRGNCAGGGGCAECAMSLLKTRARTEECATRPHGPICKR